MRAVLEPTITPRRPRLRWWREVLYVLAFYGIYTLVRNRFGSAAVGPRPAFAHALDVINIERAVGLFHEATVQSWFLGWRWFVAFWNIYYGTAHFVFTTGALIFCFHKRRHVYALWRNTLAATTAVALVGFSTFPLMPPRLLNNPVSFGGGHLTSVNYGFVDTLQKIGGLWSFDSGTMMKISNQYAAMPSLHTAWALWVTIVMWPGVRSRVGRAVLVVYPLATLFCIVVTANHYWLDGVAGVAALGVGYAIGRWITRQWAMHHAASELEGVNN